MIIQQGGLATVSGRLAEKQDYQETLGRAHP